MHKQGFAIVPCNDSFTLVQVRLKSIEYRVSTWRTKEYAKRPQRAPSSSLFVSLIVIETSGQTFGRDSRVSGEGVRRDFRSEPGIYVRSTRLIRAGVIHAERSIVYEPARAREVLERLRSITPPLARLQLFPIPGTRSSQHRNRSCIYDETGGRNGASFL